MACQPRPRFSRALLLPIAAICLAGCRAADSIEATYGRRTGNGAKSVSGTSVLSGMFQEAGHRTSSWHRLSPRLESSDVIVWAPDDFQPPSDQQREWLSNWLGEGDGYGRTLVYIGRDYDAVSAYWRKIQPQAPPEQASEIARRLAHARIEHQQRRATELDTGNADWFQVEDGAPHRAGELSGSWSEGIDVAETEIDIASRWKMTTDNNKYAIDELLVSGDDVLAGRIQQNHWNDDWNEGQVIVIANGSFLLNLPLVNHQHRKLAGRLIQECEDNMPYQSQLNVVFLESGRSGLRIYKDDPDNSQTGMEALTVWPLNVVMLHAIVVGIILCFALFPIFGRPRRLKEETTSDFGKHIDALGELLARTRDSAYARDRLVYYQQIVKRDSGVSHKAPRDRAESKPPPPG